MMLIATDTGNDAIVLADTGTGSGGSISAGRGGSIPRLV